VKVAIRRSGDAVHMTHVATHTEQTTSHRQSQTWRWNRYNCCNIDLNYRSRDGPHDGEVCDPELSRCERRLEFRAEALNRQIPGRFHCSHFLFDDT